MAIFKLDITLYINASIVTLIAADSQEFRINGGTSKIA